MSIIRYMKIVLVILVILIFQLLIVFADSGPIENVQSIVVESFFNETKTIGNDEFLAYTFSGVDLYVVNIDVDVINGEEVDIFLMNSEDFISYQSVMLGGDFTQFSSYSVGRGMKVKSKSYTFEFPKTDRYYLIIDNTFQPEYGALPSGSVDVKVTIVDGGCPKLLDMVAKIDNVSIENKENVGEMVEKAEKQGDYVISELTVIYLFSVFLILYCIMKVKKY